MNVRPATDDDSDFVWRLSMEPSVRDASVRHDEFTFEDHDRWFARRLNEATTKFYIGEVDGEPVGQVRYGVDPNDSLIAEIAISILPEQRGFGYSYALLQQTEAIASKALGVSTLAALVLPDNVVSILLFQNAGYRYVREEIRLGRQVRRYEKEVAPSASEPETWGPVIRASS